MENKQDVKTLHLELRNLQIKCGELTTICKKIINCTYTRSNDIIESFYKLTEKTESITKEQLIEHLDKTLKTTKFKGSIDLAEVKIIKLAIENHLIQLESLIEQYELKNMQKELKNAK